MSPRALLRPGYAVIALAVAAGAGLYASRVEGTEAAPRERDPAVPALGVNFVRFAAVPGTSKGPREGARPGPPLRDRPLEPDEVAEQFEALGVGAMRQLTDGDLGWRAVESADDAWELRNADRALIDAAAEPIVTLFDLQYASPNPPWAGPDTPFAKTLGPEARDYVTTVVTRYRDHVRYWEIGNEMDHWRAADPGPKAKAPPRPPPANTPPEGFTPEEQGRFFAEVAALVREIDPDAVIVMPGMAGLDDYVLDTWLPGFVEGAGAAIDVVNYHHYGPWRDLAQRRQKLDHRLADLGLAGKPVWLTETGVTSDPTLQARTRYPNSEEEQAADVVRRAMIGWGSGDELVLWHCYWDSPGGPHNAWRGYGLVREDGSHKPAWTAFRALATEIAPWARIERVDAPQGQWIWRVQREDGTVRWVAWGEGKYKLPDGADRVMATVVADGESSEWARAKKAIELSDRPVILGP